MNNAYPKLLAGLTLVGSQIVLLYGSAVAVAAMPATFLAMAPFIKAVDHASTD